MIRCKMSLMDPSPPFSLSQLSGASDEKERTIRSWIREGLLPPARGKGRGSFYDQEHMDRLGFVVQARRKLGSWPLGALRELLDLLYAAGDSDLVHRIATGDERIDVLRNYQGGRDLVREATDGFLRGERTTVEPVERKFSRWVVPEERADMVHETFDVDPRPYTTIQIEPDLELRLRGDDPERVAWLARLSRRLREWIRDGEP